MLRRLHRLPPRPPPWPRLLCSTHSPVSVDRPSPPATPPTAILTTASPPPSLRGRRHPIFLLSAAAVAALLSGAAILSVDPTLERTKTSMRHVAAHMSHTIAAARVLLESLASVLSSANHEVKLGFGIRVAALLADISAASAARRAAIVSAGGGKVVDWLLESVAGGGAPGVQAEAARALAHLIADADVRTAVLGRPHAVPYLLKFIFLFQPKKPKKHYSSFDSLGNCRGRSMLVAALMDIVTSNCDDPQCSSFRPLLPKNADMRDIMAAIEVVEEGGMHFDEYEGSDDKGDGDKGLSGIGIKVLGGTSILGFSRTSSLLKMDNINEDVEDCEYVCKNIVYRENITSNPKVEKLTSTTVPGLWDDLQREHIAVPFAAWALANWAVASERNRSHIQELDRDGYAVMTALTAPERTVKWHGSLVARALLSDQNLPLSDSVPEWSSSLLATASQASKIEDTSLTQMALTTFILSIKRSNDAKVALMEKGLQPLRKIAKQTENHRNIQESLPEILELLYDADMHLSLEESQKWSDIILRWVFNKFSSETARRSATKIMSCVLEDYGPNLIPVSQGWLATLLSEILNASKTLNLNGASDKVKTQVDQANALVATQVANQLATAVVKLAIKQSEFDPDSIDKSPLAGFLSMEQFSAQVKNLAKHNSTKFDAAESAVATLKGIKALTELCSERDIFKNKLSDFGVLCLLRRFLLGDDYEKLAAFEAYDASQNLENQEREPNDMKDSAASESKDSSSVRVPPTAHLRRHAARLLTVLSFLPKVKEAIMADRILCKWLEDCANGRSPRCNDLKIRSYSRATLLNIACLDQANAETNGAPEASGRQDIKCPQYADMIFLINPESSYWSYSAKEYPSNISRSPSVEVDGPSGSLPADGDMINEVNKTNNSVDGSDLGSQEASPLFDVIFVHGLRGGPFKSWRIAESKSSTTSRAGLVEKIDQEAGKQGTFWPSEWLAADFPHARLFSLKYKTNLTQWSGASLPLQEVSSMLLQKLVAAGIGERPIVFVTHSMGGLLVKQILYQAKMDNLKKLVNNTVGVVFYSCPHFGSRLADMPWRMGLILRPAPSIGELRSGSPRLVELNDFVRQLHSKGFLDVLSFSETQVTPIVEGYGGWAFRLEIVPIESAYPGYGELVVLDATDHINSCKPVNKTDPSYSETLDFLWKLKARIAK